MRRSNRLTLVPVLAAFALIACSSTDRDPLSGSGSQANGSKNGNVPTIENEGSTTPTSGNCNQEVDVVFVMDVSTSMETFLNKLAYEMPVVDAAIKTVSPTAAPSYGLAVFVDDVKMINSGAPFPDVGSLKKEFETWAGFTSSNRQLHSGGSNSTWPENSLDALYLAATSFSWRDGSLRIVIHTTDDTFWEGPVSNNGVSVQHGYSDTLQALMTRQVRVFTFASKRGGPGESDDVSAGWFAPYNGQPPVPTATAGGAYELDEVVSGNQSLAVAIKGFVQQSICKEYPKIR